MTVLVATGLKREARIITRPGVVVIAGGGDSARLERELDDLAEFFPGVILSSGLAGALDPSLKVGDVIIDGDPALLARLREALPGAIVGRVVGQDHIAATSADKRALRAATGAVAVDMESHVAARVAARRELPFGVVRVVSDSATHDLPPAALVGMRAGGEMALGPVLASLMRSPAQLPALIRAGWNAEKAFRELGRVHDMLGRSGVFGLDLRQLALDMA